MQSQWRPQQTIQGGLKNDPSELPSARAGSLGLYTSVSPLVTPGRGCSFGLGSSFQVLVSYNPQSGWQQRALCQ